MQKVHIAKAIEIKLLVIDIKRLSLLKLKFLEFRKVHAISLFCGFNLYFKKRYVPYLHIWYITIIIDWL